MKILIVDDEVIIRTGLSRVIDWQSLGLELLEPALSAEEALDSIAREKPEIVLTDIRMAGKNGLFLAKETKRLLPDTEIIILTGYDEFAYAQDAIRSGVSDYLLKTSRPAEIIQAVLRSVQRIRDKQSSKDKAEFRRQETRKRILEKLVLESDSDLEESLIQSHFPGWFPLQGRALQVIVLLAEGWGANSPNGLLSFAVSNMLQDLLSCETLIVHHQPVAIVTIGKDWDDDRVLQEAVSLTGRQLKCQLFAAAGTEVNEIRDIAQSYEIANYVAGYRELHPQLQWLTYEHIKERKGGRTGCTRSSETELCALLLENNRMALKTWLNQVVQEQMLDPNTTLESLASFLHSIAICGFRWLEQVTESDPEGIAPLPSFHTGTPSSHRDMLFQYLNDLMKVYHQHYAGGSLSYAKRAAAYVRQNMGKQEISLTRTARYLHLHPNHFSEVFKKETGITFGDFVIRERIERAKQLLLELPIKVADVSRKVGYEDVKYFSQQFKKYTGTTPTEFREKTAGKARGRW